MAIRYDMHMHSSFSTDSDASMESMVRRARELALAGVCFTEHMDLDYPSCYFPTDPHAFEADPDAVYQEVLRLREAARRDAGPDVWIGFGLEFGMQGHLAGAFHRIAKSCPLDFIVASQHLVGGLDPYYPEVWEGRACDALIRQYYEEMLTNLRQLEEWDTLAHLDYIIRYIPGREEPVYDSMRQHAEVIDEILRHVIGTGRCLEVNTAGYKYGLGQPNPAPSILKRYKELGGERITIASDAHAPGHIAVSFDEVEGLLSSLGFESYCVFTGRRMKQLQLSSISS